MGTAQADEASFVQAFANVCAQFVPFGLGGTMEAFTGYGWDVHLGADPGEFEAYMGETSAFVATSAARPKFGCTVMDEKVSMASAHALLARTLDLNFSHAVKGTGYNNTDVWRVAQDNGTLVFHVLEDLSGNGSAIAFELRP